MTTLVIGGATPATLHVLRYALGQPAIEVVGIATEDPGEVLAYRFVVDSAPTPFRGNATYKGDVLELAGRYGRGGLRHDHILVSTSLDSLIAGAREVDCLVLSETWPESGVDLGVRSVVRVGADVPDPVSDTVTRLADVLKVIAPIRQIFVSTSGRGNAAATPRESRLAARGNRVGSAAAVGRAGGPVALDIIEPLPARVFVTSTFIEFSEPVSDDALRRRLRSAGRGVLAGHIRQDEGPVGAQDVVGSPVSVLDVGTLHITDQTAAFAFFTDPIAVSTRLVVDLVSRSAGAE